MKIIRPLAEHHDAWNVLYTGYADFYKVEQTPEMRNRVWSWLHDAQHSVKGFIAIDDAGKPVGLTHYRPYARPLMATTGCFLDDLFVDPATRGQKIAEALIAAVVAEARAQGWGLVRWITAEDNYRARGLYDRVSTKTKWTTYEIKI
jgi:ribosomal protein S18 acetylase RimI-like enzyme